MMTEGAFFLRTSAEEPNRKKRRAGGLTDAGLTIAFGIRGLGGR